MGGYLTQALALVLNRLTVDKLPHKVAESLATGLKGQVGFGIADGGRHLQTVAHDAWVGEQLGDFAVVVARYFFCIKVVKRQAVVLTFLEHRGPRQAGLRALQVDQLKQSCVVAQGHAPLGVVVVAVEVKAFTPGAALHTTPFRVRSLGSPFNLWR